MVKAKEYYAKKFPDQKVPMVAMGYSLGGAIAVAIERVYGKEQKVFDAHVLVVPNMGLDPAMQVPEDKLKEIRLMPPTTGLFPFMPNPEDFLKDYYADPLQYTGPV